MIKLGRFFFRYRNVLGPAVFGLALALSQPRYPFASEDLHIAFGVAGGVLVSLGELLRIVTIGYEYIVRGGKNRAVYAKELVQGGMFSLCRNPLYVGNILMAAGLALVINATAFYLIVIPAIVLAYRAIVAAEEAYLREKFGAQYDDYCARVNRWWPRLTRFPAAVAGMRFNWRRVLVKEYTTIFILIGAFFCLWEWSEYSERGAGALPSTGSILTGALVWIAAYLAVRALKKSSVVRD
jgi:protein-S-isoprenylcysteine O-methyltransferase Ste14